MLNQKPVPFLFHLFTKFVDCVPRGCKLFIWNRTGILTAIINKFIFFGILFSKHFDVELIILTLFPAVLMRVWIWTMMLQKDGSIFLIVFAHCLYWGCCHCKYSTISTHLLCMMNFQPNWLHVVHSGAISYYLFCYIVTQPPSPHKVKQKLSPKSTNLTWITSRWWMLGNSKQRMCGWSSYQQVLPGVNFLLCELPCHKKFSFDYSTVLFASGH